MSKKGQESMNSTNEGILQALLEDERDKAIELLFQAIPFEFFRRLARNSQDAEAIRSYWSETILKGMTYWAKKEGDDALRDPLSWGRYLVRREARHFYYRKKRKTERIFFYSFTDKSTALNGDKESAVIQEIDVYEFEKFTQTSRMHADKQITREDYKKEAIKHYLNSLTIEDKFIFYGFQKMGLKWREIALCNLFGKNQEEGDWSDLADSLPLHEKNELPSEEEIKREINRAKRRYSRIKERFKEIFAEPEVYFGEVEKELERSRLLKQESDEVQLIYRGVKEEGLSLDSEELVHRVLELSQDGGARVPTLKEINSKKKQMKKVFKRTQKKLNRLLKNA